MMNVNQPDDPMPETGTALDFGAQLGELINNPAIAHELAEKLGAAVQKAVKDLDALYPEPHVQHTYMLQPGTFTLRGETVHGFKLTMSIVAQEDSVERGTHYYLALNSTFDHVKSLAREDEIQEWKLDLPNQA
jgi:hypothetical protein